MSGPRDIVHDEPLLRIKVATRKAVKAVHGTQLAGEIMGVPQQRVSECQLPNTPDFLRLDQVLALEEAARGSDGWPQLTRAQARHHGFELLPLPGIALGDSDWHRSVGELSREVGEVVSKVCQALSDGTVQAREIRELKILEEIDEGMAALTVLRALVLRQLEGDK